MLDMSSFEKVWDQIFLLTGNRNNLAVKEALEKSVWLMLSVYQKGVQDIVQRMKSHGTFLCHTEFKSKYHVECTSTVIKSLI